MELNTDACKSHSFPQVIPDLRNVCARRVGTRFDRSSNAADVAAHDRRDQATADVNSLDDLHVGRLGHRVGRLNQADQSACLH